MTPMPDGLSTTPIVNSQAFGCPQLRGRRTRAFRRPGGDTFSNGAPILVEPGFFILALLGSFATAGVIHVGYTPACLALGIYLFRVSQARYFSFLIWLWFLSPFFRRVADYYSSYIEPSPMLLAPVLVSLICIVPVMKSGGRLFARGYLPFSLAGLAMLYALFIGALQWPLHFVVTDCLRWAVPLIVAIHYFSLRDEGVTEAIEKAFLYGVSIMGAYAIYQSLALPAWDMNWVANLGDAGGGFGNSESLRVFSTMNSPGPFAATIAGCALMLSIRRRWLARAAQMLGIIGVLVSEVRSAWIGIAAGFMYILVAGNRETRMRMLQFAAATAVGLAIALSGLQQDSGNLTKRLSTFTDIKGDVSYYDRAQGNSRALTRALHRPLGGGLGYLDSGFFINGDAAGTGMGPHDSGPYEIIATFGYLGVLFYGAALILMAASVRGKHYRSPRQVVCQAVCLSMLVQMPSGNTLDGVDGFIFWLAAAMLLKPERDSVMDPTAWKSRESAVCRGR